MASIEYLSHLAEIRVFHNFVHMKVLDCTDAALDSDVMMYVLDKVIENVQKIDEAHRDERNNIVLVFDLRGSSNMSVTMCWTLLQWLRKTKPYLSTALDFTHVVGAVGVWATVLRTVNQFIETARPVHIDSCSPEVLKLFQ